MRSEIDTNNFLNRYPGVKPFSVSENFMFFGRQTDVEALNTLIFLKQTVVLYGKSGYGKSSLINAGIIPKLQENESWSYFSIRFNNYFEKETEQNLSPLQTVKKRLSENIKPSPKNVLDKLIPNENSFWYWVKQHQLHNEKTNFIFFFDQFEELFTYSKEQISEFSEQLSELLYNTLPLKFKNRIAEAEENNVLTDDEHDFLYQKPDVKVVFSIRSDRLSLLNSLTDKHPYILKHCYELNALNTTDAKQAIVEPAKLSKDFGFLTPEFSFTPQAIEKILNSIANPDDGKIEAATLQIICRFVEDNLVAVQNNLSINEADLGEIADIFQHYYENILSKLSKKERHQAQHLIEDELIDGSRRNPLSATYITTKFGLTEQLLNQLEQSSLLRKERDASGRILYEVSHDSLVTAIEKVAQDRRKDEEVIEKLQLEQQIKEEKKKTQELELLNKKAVFRYKLAFVLAFLSLGIAVVAVYFRQQSVTASELANDKTREAEIALFNNKLIESKSIIIKAKSYMAFEEYDLARNELTKAKNLLSNTYDLPKSINTEKEITQKKIDSLLIKCTR